jgi:hypothetical protein
MGRLIAFDPQTASALVAKTRTAAQLGHGSPLKAALANEGEATLLMRASTSNDVLVVSVRHPQPAPQVVAPLVTTSEVTRSEGRRNSAPPPNKPAMPAPHVSKPAPPPKVESVRGTATSAAPIAAAPAPATPAPAAPAQQKAKPVTSAITSHSDASDSTLAKQADVPKKPAARDDEPVAYEATGFLGLEDSPLYAEDLEPQPKKKWWRKILD